MELSWKSASKRCQCKHIRGKIEEYMEQTTVEQYELRKHAFESSFGSVRLEGLSPSPELVEDLEHWAAGKLSLSEIRERLFVRFAQQDAA